MRYPYGNFIPFLKDLNIINNNEIVNVTFNISDL